MHGYWPSRRGWLWGALHVRQWKIVWCVTRYKIKKSLPCLLLPQQFFQSVSQRNSAYYLLQVKKSHPPASPRLDEPFEFNLGANLLPNYRLDGIFSFAWTVLIIKAVLFLYCRPYLLVLLSCAFVVVPFVLFLLFCCRSCQDMWVLKYNLFTFAVIVLVFVLLLFLGTGGCRHGRSSHGKVINFIFHIGHIIMLGFNIRCLIINTVK